jgi:pseudouridine-5'-phosphate glycosidase
LKTVEECAALISIFFFKIESVLNDLQLSNSFFLDANIQLQLNSGMLIAVPIPENEAADANRIQKAINIALAEAKYL